MTAAPAAVTLQVWRIPPRRVPAAVVASQLLVQRLRRRRDVSFAKVLGTASSAFLPSAVTPRRWAALTCWREAPATVVTWFDRHADEQASLSLQPLSTRGSWDRRQPFGEATADTAPDGPVLVLTRSTLRLSRARRFYRAITPVAEELHASSACRVAFGIGEAPLRRQGTVSLWTSAAEMTRFAYGAPHHRAAITTTPDQRWYVEELFTRFAVVEASGSIDGVVL
jgi:hypothetical protein